MFKKFLLVIVIAFVLFLLGGFLLPRLVHVERSIEINRPAAAVFTLLNSYSTFATWSPWAERDPDAIYEFSGPESGVGARMSWSGDPRLVGSGWQEITESHPASLIRTRLFFDQQGAAASYFQLDQTAAGVLVTWGFDTDVSESQGFLGGLLARYFGLLFDRWIGTDYEQGLAKLKIHAESMAEPEPAPVVIEQVDAEGLQILYISSGSGGGAEAVADSLAAAFQQISAFMQENGIEMAEQPMAINRAGGEQGYQLDAAIPIQTTTIESDNRVQQGQSPSGPAVRLVHRGAYRNMAASYRKLDAYMEAHGLPAGQVSWEHYISDPGETPEEDLITHIYMQIGN